MTAMPMKAMLHLHTVDINISLWHCCHRICHMPELFCILMNFLSLSSAYFIARILHKHFPCGHSSLVCVRLLGFPCNNLNWNIDLIKFIPDNMTSNHSHRNQKADQNHDYRAIIKCDYEQNRTQKCRINLYAFQMTHKDLENPISLAVMNMQ